MFDGMNGPWGGFDFRVSLLPGGLISYFSRGSRCARLTVNSKKNVIDDSWHHVVLTKNFEMPIKIYIDGALDAEG